MTILLMIFVNYGAGNLTSLKHVPWDGFNLADSVFPFFIFIMGSTIAVSFRNISTINENRSKIITRILKRSMNLFVLGIIINSIGSADIKTIRIPGVLQRFALSYGIVALTQLVTVNLITSSLMPRCLNCFKLWPQYALASIMLFIYLYFTLFWQFDQNCPIGYMGPGGLYDNISYPFCIGGAAHKIDEIIFTKNHCYRNNFGGVLYDQGLFNLWHDPEGLLGTTTSIILTVIGLQVGHTILHNIQPWARFRRLINIVVILAIAACFSVFVLRIPINKNLWSFSFVALNGCLATSIFIIFHYLIDHRKIWPKGYPLNYPGQNSIMLYLGHEIANDMFPFKLASSYSSHIGYLAQDLFSTAIWWIISCWMASKQIFITV
ncbi:Sars1 allergen [Sarcoptes scabiei]|nr:Sars1 allergen [Sarcoptes scabiei]